MGRGIRGGGRLRPDRGDRIATATAARSSVATLWRFSRPHTIIGTALSVAGIFAIAAHELGPLPAGKAAFHLAVTLLVGLAVNVFITGINQIQDVEIDRINKPFLPIAAGHLSLGAARAIVIACGAGSLVLAVSQGWIETAAVGAAVAIGWAYSCPPLHLKRFPVAASASISIVRSLVVNLGVYLHFSTTFADTTEVADAVWALTLFVIPFSFAIAVLKDVPDAAGDSQFDIRTFTVRLGGRTAFRMGMAALVIAYAGMAAFGPGGPVHLAVLALLLWWAARVDLDDFTPFYMRVWMLFFLEYLIVPAAILSGL